MSKNKRSGRGPKPPQKAETPAETLTAGKLPAVSEAPAEPEVAEAPRPAAVVAEPAAAAAPEPAVEAAPEPAPEALATAAPEPAPAPEAAPAPKAPAQFRRLLRAKALSDNAVLLRLLAICTVLGATTALKNGLMLSAAAVFVTILLYLAMVPLKNLPAPWFQGVAMLAAAVLFTPFYMFCRWFAPQVTASCSFYLPLTIVNAVLMLDLRVLRGKRPVVRSLAAGLGDVIGYSVVLLLFSVAREVIAAGTLYGKAIPGFIRFRFSFLSLAPGAFLLLGLVLAAVQAYRLRRGSPDKHGEAQ